MRRYARYLQRLGYEIRITDYKLITASAFHALSGSIDRVTYCRESGASYEPELFPAIMFRKGSVHFSCHLNGKLLSIKSSKDLDDFVYPTLI